MVNPASDPAPPGENSIIIVGGANMADWSFSQEADQVQLCRVRVSGFAI